MTSRSGIPQRKDRGMMTDSLHGVTILLADDDEEDRAMTISALRERRVANEIRCVGDGEELVRLPLPSRQVRECRRRAPSPGLILLDLNMPKKDGREVLAEIKADAGLRSIPVVVLTTSKAEEDIARTYDLGVNSFITKPVTFDGLVQAMDAFSRYWLEIVELPNELAAYDERVPTHVDPRRERLRAASRCCSSRTTKRTRCSHAICSSGSRARATS